MLNDTIVSELNDVKKMLDKKAKTLSQRETDINKKERDFAVTKAKAIKEIEAAFQAKLAETE